MKTLIINATMNNWSTGVIVPIYKKGDKDNPANYRGITLTCAMSKLFTFMLNRRINEWAEEFSILTQAQFAYKPGYKALKFVYNDFTSSYADLRKLARRPLMYTERQRCILVEVYKCLNHISPPYLHDMFNVKDLPYSLRNDSIVALPKYNYIKYVKYSILYDGATLWNTLDKNIVHAQSLSDFKRMLQTWGGVTCSCMVCKSCCLNNM